MGTHKIYVVLLLAIFFGLQYASLDYGSKINDYSYFQEYKHNDISTDDTALKKRSIIDNSKVADETISKWMLRFKLYSIEADEVYSIMALSRVKVQKLDFDTHYYQYGGAFLYPLGAFYFALIKIGVLHVGNFEKLVSDPNTIDGVYFFGRLFVLLTFVFSAYIFYKTLLLLSSPLTSLLLLGIYLFSPISLMFSQVMKPHWYALLWINISLFILVKLFINHTWSRRDIFLFSIALGLAVGSASIISLYAILVWILLVYAVSKRYTSFRALIVIPLLSLLFFLILNPYIILNYDAYVLEMQAINRWIKPTIEPSYIFTFIKNSMLSGFGVASSIFALLFIITQLIHPRKNVLRIASVLFIISIIFISFLTADMSYWHVNLRYAPYLIPCLVLFTSFFNWKHKNIIFSFILILTVVQSLPLIIAYHDENSPAHSTRLASAAWIEQHIPPGATLTMDSVAPYNTPPIDYTEYTLIPDGGDYYVRFDRQMDFVHPPAAYSLAKRFRPRFSPESFPLVFSHINPQISIYKKDT